MPPPPWPPPPVVDVVGLPAAPPLADVVGLPAAPPLPDGLPDAELVSSSEHPAIAKSASSPELA
jgi:hypothetical protein